MTPKIRILNADILSITQDTLLQQLDKGVLITPNLDHLVKIQQDREFYEIYQKAEWVICDSKILFFLSKLLKKSLPEAIPGSSFFTAFYNFHKNDTNCKIFLLGAMDGVAYQAKNIINKKVGREIVVGAMSPSLGFETKQEENELIYKVINDSGANVVLVGVGAPKQEKWIFSHKEKMPNVNIWMALGATIDFEAGNLERAPKWMQNIGMEWLYRFLKEPKRMFRRYFIDDMCFFWHFFKQMLGIYINPFADESNKS